MRPGNAQLSADWLANRPAAVAQIRAALEAESGRVRPAAKRLGVHWRTLYRWIEDDPGLGVIVRAYASTVPPPPEAR